MNNSSDNGFDVIGDLHGHSRLFLQMLELLGYQAEGGSYAHPLGRKILLVGDLINRGPDSNGVLKIARNMHENGTALIILGNHEFRLIQRGVAQKPLDDDSYQPYLSWIRSLPLFVETPTLRSVHAAWHYSSIQILEGAKASDDAFVKKTFEKETPEGKAVNNILSGIKISLPLEPKLKDRFGIVRKKGRVRWWKNLQGKSFAECLYSPMYPEVREQIPDPNEIAQVEPYDERDKPVFLGHYSLPPSVEKVMDMVVCVDGCVTKDKKLWGYRHGGEPRPQCKNLVSCG
ncbi:MAG TPA: hypothetical protein DCY32_02720 [Opitutae bacterium]|nr:hypothetical protein [Opitutae bacterium]